ncbi:MAG: hypothetical protein HFG63_03680 [Lachnospiraceae bacterium]|nr:hypothetical protein [Lachnospiraceae bacterium]
MKIKEESGLKFSFEDQARPIKYDDSSFYRNYMNHLPAAKGVDFISVQEGRLVFTEVKNCKGHEHDNNWRICPDNKKRDTSHTTVDTEGRDSLDIEISEKVAMTICGLVGAFTKAAGTGAAEELAEYADILMSPSARKGNKQLLVILFLEGDFGCETRPKKMIMWELERSIRKKLEWLNCLVSVVDSGTYQKKIFQVEA